MRKSTLAVLLGLLLCGGSASAQEQRASLEGVVKDNTGAVVPGASVEAKNLAQGDVTAAVTDDQGQFRFPALRPGAYQVTASLTSFAPAKFDRVDLALGEIKRVELTLGVAGVAENVQVTAEQPLIDVKQNQRAFNITAEQFERLPRGRDFSSIVTQAPGANQEARSGGISIDGSSASENRYIIDGVETTNPQNGTRRMDFPLDFVGELQVKSSGYTAEYGGATGGVINVISRSGTNRFSGNAGLYFTNDALQSDPRRTLRLTPTDTTQAEYITYPEDPTSRLDPGFAIGGPIKTDRLWFYGSYFPGLEKTERTANLSNGTPVTTEQTDRTQSFAANVTAKLTDKATGKFAYNHAYRYIKGILPAQNGSSSPLTVFDTNDIRPTYSTSGYVDYTASDRLYLGVRGGYYFQNQYNENIPDVTKYTLATQSIGVAGVPPQFQQVSNFTNVFTNRSVTRNEYPRVNVQADATYYANFAGQHTFKGGVQFDRIANDVFDAEQQNLLTVRFDRAYPLATGPVRGTFGYYEVRSNGVSPEQGFIVEGNVSNTNVGFFVQDSWTINNRLTLNLGLRTENEGVPAYTTEGITRDVAIEWGFADKLAPRLGFAWDVTGDGRTKAFGNWGLYYDVFKMELPRGSFGGDKWLQYYYTLDTFDYTALDPAGCPPACPGRLIDGPIDFRHPSFDIIDPDLKPMRMQEATFGIEREVGRNMAVSARYVHKQIDRAVEDIGSIDPATNSEIFAIGNPGFGTSAFFPPAGSTELIPFPKAVRDYDALELGFDKRLSNRWEFRASYTLSRLYGNYSGLSQSDENGRTSPNVGRNFDYSMMSFDGNGQPVLGRLATDRPHQVKLLGNYELPFGTLVGLHQYVASGVPVSREAAAIAGHRYPIQYRGRLSDGRTPTFSETGMYLQHQFRLGGVRNFEVGVDIRNLFDQKTTINRFQAQLASASGAVVNFNESDLYAGRVNFDTLISALNQRTAIDPRFLQDSDFQLPRLIRFRVMFNF